MEKKPIKTEEALRQWYIMKMNLGREQELMKLANTPIKTKTQAIIYIARLHELDCGYHMDDDAFDIECFDGISDLINKRRDECFEQLNHDDYCPHAISMACLVSKEDLSNFK
jgi:hypothetical protein